MRDVVVARVQGSEPPRRSLLSLAFRARPGAFRRAVFTRWLLVGIAANNRRDYAAMMAW
jgi:hypothetical protein